MKLLLRQAALFLRIRSCLLTAAALTLHVGPGCATTPTIQGQAQGIGLSVQHASERTRGDTSNDASVFWALVVNNALVALGLPVIAGLFWYKRKQVNHGKV